MRQRLVITDVTQMPHGDEVCVVGINEAGESVRPVCEGGFKKSYRYCNSRLAIYPRAEVEFDFIKDLPQPPHVEDKVFNPDSIVYIGEYDENRWEQILNKTSLTSMEQIFEGNLKSWHYVLPGINTHSIGTLGNVSINLLRFDSRVDIIKPRLIFKDGLNRAYDLPINDLAIREICYERVKKNRENAADVCASMTDELQQARKIYLRIGLSRPWMQDGTDELRCYPQVTGIHMFTFYNADSINKISKVGDATPIEILEALAHGIDPYTGEIMDKESPFNNPSVIHALSLAANSLQNSDQRPLRQGKMKPANAGKAWSNEEDNKLIEEYKNRMPLGEIAGIHGRTQVSINARLIRLGFFNFD